MQINHPIRNLFLLILVVFPINWFIFVFPFKTANEFFTNLPTYVSTSVIDQYPEDLKVTVKNGEVGLNRATPYCLKLNDTEKMGIVFDTTAEPKVTAFDVGGPYSDLCEPIVVVGSNYYMYVEKEQIKISKITPQANFTIDKPSITNFVDKYLPAVISFGKNAYYTLPFVGVVLAFGFFLLNNFWYSFIAQLFVKMFKLGDIKSSDVYSVTLFFYSVINFIQWVIVDDIINQLFKQSLVLTFPFMNTILISIATVVYFKNNPPSIPTPEPTPPPVQNPVSTPEIR